MTYRFALLAALLATGCAYRTPDVHVPSALATAPTLERDITVIDARTAIDDHTVDEVRAEATSLLAHTGGAVVHAQVVLEDHRNYADHAINEDGIAVFGLWPVAFGMTYESEKVDVDVDVEANGRVFHGHGEAEKDGSLYAHARRRALAAAFDRALASAH